MRKLTIGIVLLLGFILSTGVASADDVWISDSLIISGLVDVGSDSRPCIFNDSGTLKLICGANDGLFDGYYWSGSTWVSDPSIINGLTDVGYDSAPTVFQMDGTWYLIAGEFDGLFYGWHWTGSAWTSDSSIINGLTDVLGESSPEVFNNGGWKLISGANTNLFHAWYWNGSAWVPDSSIINGLGSAGYMSQLTIFDDGGTLKMIVGKGSGTFYGWQWTGSAWTSNSLIVSGLTDVGDECSPYVFDDSGTFKIIVGANDGLFYGWSSEEVFAISGTISNETGAVNNATITLSDAGGSTTSNEIGYYEITEILSGTYSIDVTEALHYNYSDTVTITSDTEKNIFLTVIPVITPTPTSIIAPPPVIPIQEPTPIITEETKLTIIEETIEESIEKLRDLSILITDFVGKGMTWTFLLVSYVGAIVAHLSLKKEDEEPDVFNILLFGTVAWIMLLLINTSGYIITVSTSFILNSLIFGIAGFAVYTVLDMVSSKE